ncbi:DUF4089 domain-containing protein [Falsiroseomonas sp.]|uniref:DUF4089 domain-containing protein n=1 Tax=Falsiroseomonas sp. TaxID=2870721 RepID=UPI003561C47F
MSDPAPFDAEAYARAAAALVGLPLDARHLPGVAANLRIAARMAAALEGMPLGPADEPAPVFVAAPAR